MELRSNVVESLTDVPVSATVALDTSTEGVAFTSNVLDALIVAGVVLAGEMSEKATVRAEEPTNVPESESDRVLTPVGIVAPPDPPVSLNVPSVSLLFVMVTVNEPALPPGRLIGPQPNPLVIWMLTVEPVASAALDSVVGSAMVLLLAAVKAGFGAVPVQAAFT